MTALFSATKYQDSELREVLGFPQEIDAKRKSRDLPYHVRNLLSEMAKFLPGVVRALSQGIFQFQTKKGDVVAVVHRSTQENRDEYPWQVSLFDPTGPSGVPEPIGHVSAKDLRGVARGLVEEHTVMPSSLMSGRLVRLTHAEALHQARAIQSLTLTDLRKSEDWPFLKKGKRRAELSAPIMNRVFASTAEYLTKSSKYIKNQKIYVQKILFKDFAFIARDRQIPFKDAIKYSIDSGDVHVNCSCPSFLYHGFRYEATQLDYLYGIPRERRFPIEKNPELKSVYCKHLSRVVEQIIHDEQLLISKFADFYGRHHELEDIDLGYGGF